MRLLKICEHDAEQDVKAFQVKTVQDMEAYLYLPKPARKLKCTRKNVPIFL